MGRPVFALAGERGRSFLSPTGGDNAFGLFGDKTATPTYSA
jgi:hypothetical protein